MKTIALSTVSLALVALAACSSSSPSPSPTPTKDSGSTGWRAVVGKDGTFVHTFDEKEWTVRALGNVDLLGVSCIGNDVGWAVGAHGVIARTEDGGRSWSWQSSGTTTTLRAVAFADLSHGIAVGDDGFVRSTTDGGLHWITPPSGGEALPLAAAWANGGAFYAVGASAQVLHGPFDALVATTIAGAGDLRAVTARGSHVVAGDDRGALFESFDGGNAWKQTGTAAGAIGALAITERGDVIAAGAGGTISQSSQTGTWVTIASPSAANLHAAVPTATGVFLAGDHGTLMVLDGTAVRAIPLATTADLFGVDSFE